MGCGASSLDTNFGVKIADEELTFMKNSNGELIELNGYIIVEVIHGGNRSTIYKALKDGEVYAIKEVPKMVSHDSEIAIHKQFSNHQRVVNIIEVLSGSKMVYIVMEYLSGGPLCSISPSGILLEECWSEGDAKIAFSQICDIIKELHSHGTVHCNIQPGSILWTDTTRKNLKICDFGSAKTIKTSDENSLFPVDAWAMGACLYLVLNGSYPWRMAQPMKEINDISLQSSVEFKIPRSYLCQQVMIKLLSLDSFTRMTLAEFSFSLWLLTEKSPQLVNLMTKKSRNNSLRKIDFTKQFNNVRGKSRTSRTTPQEGFLFAPVTLELDNLSGNKPFEILICDGDKKSMKALTSELSYLAQRGTTSIRVMQCHDQESAIKKLESCLSVDLIFISLDDNQLNGLELCKTLRKFPHYDLVPVVGIASVFSDALSENSVEVGADNLVSRNYFQDVMELLKRSGYGNDCTESSTCPYQHRVNIVEMRDVNIRGSLSQVSLGF